MSYSCISKAKPWGTKCIHWISTANLVSIDWLVFSALNYVQTKGKYTLT